MRSKDRELKKKLLGLGRWKSGTPKTESLEDPRRMILVLQRFEEASDLDRGRYGDLEESRFDFADDSMVLEE
ncbi:hypothetical protein BY996DRAFT_6472213 [Phakopsora pachyrhizi]|nr:hypothetical protein BY996DRAFT_6472213 [Phakopsora pachyrhizi]